MITRSPLTAQLRRARRPLVARRCPVESQCL